MAETRVVIITDGEINKPEVFDTPAAAFAVLAVVTWTPQFFNENILDLIKGDSVNHEGVEYRFYSYDDFTDLDDE